MYSAYPHLNNLRYTALPDSPEAKAMEATPEFKAMRAALETAHAAAEVHRDPKHAIYQKAIASVAAATDALWATPQHQAYQAMLKQHGIEAPRHVARDVTA
jgi:hypothetical protein